MPQDTLLPDDPRLTGLSIEWKEVIDAKGPRWRCTIRVYEWPGDPATVHVSDWEGVMLDYVATLSSEVASAFMFDSRREVPRAAAGILRLARRHRQRFGRLQS